jgi:hypothetical protein
MASAVLMPNCQGESCFDMIGLRVGKGVPWRPALLELAFDRHGGFDVPTITSLLASIDTFVPVPVWTAA